MSIFTLSVSDVPKTYTIEYNRIQLRGQVLSKLRNTMGVTEFGNLGVRVVKD